MISLQSPELGGMCDAGYIRIMEKKMEALYLHLKGYLGLYRGLYRVYVGIS